MVMPPRGLKKRHFEGEDMIAVDSKGREGEPLKTASNETLSSFVQREAESPEGDMALKGKCHVLRYFKTC